MSLASSQWLKIKKKKKVQLHKQRIYISGIELKLPFDHNSDNESVAAGQVLSEKHILFTEIPLFGGERESF